jgi:hypothetical protein
MKYLLALTLLFVSVPYSMAFLFPDGNQEPAIAFACKDCDFLAAEHIAVQQAPENTCSIYRNGPNAAYCESVSQEILIPVHNTRNTFKFTVTTSISSQNIPVVSVTSFFPLTATQSDLMNKYLDFYEDFSWAVSNASMSTAELSPTPIFTTDPTLSLAAKDDACESHPSYYFANATNASKIEQSMAARVEISLNGSTGAEYTNEALPAGGGLNLTTTGGGISINFVYVRNDLMVIRGDDYANRLAFNIHIASQPTLSNLAVFSLSLNTGFTNIDGYRYGAIFGGGELDLSEDALVSNCLLDVLNENSEPTDDAPTVGGGDGRFSDPFTGANIPNSSPTEFCKYSRKLKTCVTDEDAVQTCSYSTFKWIARCGNVSP